VESELDTIEASKMAAAWKETIFERLKERDGEHQKIKEMVSNYEYLWKEWEFLNSDRTRLEYERNQLQAELSRLRRAGPAVAQSSSDSPSNLELSLAQSTVVKLESRMKERDEKYLAQNEELTQLLRKNAELSGEVNSLSKELAKKDEEMAQSEARIKELSAMNTNLKVIVDELEKEMAIKSSTLQTIKDEHDVLQKAFDSLDGQNKSLTAENERLVTQMLNYKHEVAAHMNAQLTLEKDIQDLKKQLHEASTGHSPEKNPPSKIAGLFSKLTSRSKDLLVSSQEIDSLKLSRVDSIDHAIKPKKYKTHTDAHTAAVNAVCFSSTGAHMATGGFDNTVKIWEATGQDTCSLLSCTLRGCQQGVNSVQFDSDERSVLCASNDKTVRIWSLQDQRLRHTLTGHGNKVMSAKYLNDGSKVISGSHDRTLILWDIAKGQRIHTFMVGSSCNDVAIGYGMGCTFISGHFDKRVRLWDEKTKTNVEIALEGRVTSVDVSPDGHSLLCCCQDNTLRIIDLRRMCVQNTLTSDGFVVKQHSRACFSTDGVYAAAGSNNGSTFIWDCSQPSKVDTVKYDDEPISSCSWHSRGGYFVTVGENHKVVYWVE
jgi:autophagy-related protein 16